MLSIHHYQNPSQFIQDVWEEKKKINPHFSIRAWAQKLGMNGHGQLQQVLAGKRNLPKKYVPSIVKTLNLSPKEGMYLEALVGLKSAKSKNEKEYYLERLDSLAPKEKNTTFFEIECFKYLQDPLHSIIMTLIDRIDFKEDPAWIKSKLRFKTETRKIKSAIERLIKMELVSRDSDGTLKVNHSSSTNQIDQFSKYVQYFHQENLKLASDLIEKISIDKREYNSFSFNIKDDSVVQAKERIREFLNQFFQEFEAKPGTSNSTYNINVQLFNLTSESENL